MRARILLVACCLLAPACRGKRQVDDDSPKNDSAQLEWPRVGGIGLATPESVIWDSQRDLYLVSNISGSAGERDDDGFISRIRPDGSVEALRWIDGKSEGVELSAPKGLALLDDLIMVTDIDHVRRFDRETGASRGAIAVAGAKFLNDLALDHAGALWVSDMGTGKIHRIPDPRGEVVETVLEGVPGANGLAVDEQGQVWGVAKDELFRIADGQRVDVQKLPAGGLDGIVALPGGELLISSWDARAIVRGRPGGKFSRIAKGIESPADIGYDSSREGVLVPQFKVDALVFIPLAKSQ